MSKKAFVVTDPFTEMLLALAPTITMECECYGCTTCMRKAYCSVREATVRSAGVLVLAPLFLHSV